MTFDNIFSTKGQSLRDRATYITKQRKSNYIQGRLGLVIDGTGKDYEKIKKQKIELEKLGYETAMIFVNTDLETVLPEMKREKGLWVFSRSLLCGKQSKKTLDGSKTCFVKTCSSLTTLMVLTMKMLILGTYRKVGAWSRSPVRNRFVLAWIKDQKQQRNITRESSLMMRTTLMSYVG